MTSVIVSHRPSVASTSSAHPGAGPTTTTMTSTSGTPNGVMLPSPLIGGGACPPTFAMSGSKPVPMKLFATWEVDRTPPNCIPRLCSLTVTRLVLNKSLGTGVTSVVVAVKMEGSKRTLRSNEIAIPPHQSGATGGILDTELELTFSLQYPHFVKRGGNRLHVMLQRRKRYKNRPILVGFKTLAVGTVDMSLVLQKQIDQELELFGSESKLAVNQSSTGTQSDIVVGKVFVLGLSSQPVDGGGGPGSGRQKSRIGDGDDDRTETCSDDDDDDYTSPDSDSGEETPRRKTRPSRSERGGDRGVVASSGKSVRQQNLKQKFMALMKKFKVEGLGRAEQVELDREFSEAAVDPAEIDFLFDQLEEEEDEDELSDSGPDTISVGSTPKPSLKPFFGSSRSDLNESRPKLALSAHVAASRAFSSGKNEEKVASEQEKIDESNAEVIADSDILTNDDHDNEMSDPAVVMGTLAAVTTSSGEEEPRRDRSSKKTDRSFTATKQQMSQAPSQQQQQKVLKERPSNDQLLRNLQQQSAQYPGIDVASACATRKVLLEQLGRVLPADGDNLPSKVFLANTADHYGARLAEKLSDNGRHKVVCATNPTEVRASMMCLVAKIQKFCNTQTSESPPLVKVALVGADDCFVSSVLRAYVDVFSSKPPDWQTFLKFFIIPPVVVGSGGGNAGTYSMGPTSNSVAKYIGSKDEQYAALFLHSSWRELLDGKEYDVTNEIVARILKYLNSCENALAMQLPVAEAMVTYKDEKSSNDESSQVFLPFLSDVRVGSDVTSGEAEETLASNSSPSDRLTPPSSPRQVKDRSELGAAYEPVDLQLDYWTVTPQVSEVSTQSAGSSSKKGDQMQNVSSQNSGFKDSKKGDSKASIKASILQMQVLRLGDQSPGFTMHYWTAKDKKPKTTVIRLGKKKLEAKEKEAKTVEGISRLICLSKGHNAPLKVHIDGSEWTGVKFFQLSSQWQTHIKFFPVAIFQTSSLATSSSH